MLSLRSLCSLHDTTAQIHLLPLQDADTEKKADLILSTELALEKFSCLTLQTTSLALSCLLWLLQTHGPFYISSSEHLKFLCEFCISKYSDSYPRGNQLFQKYGLLTDLKKLNAIYVFKLNEYIYWYV